MLMMDGDDGIPIRTPESGCLPIGGAGRHPIGLVKPVRIKVADPGLKRRHGDLFRDIFLISAIFDL